MGAGHGDEDNLVAGLERPDAVDDQRVVDIPAALGFGDDGFERLFGHAGVVLQRHFRDAGAVVDVAHQAEKAGQCADPGVGCPECGQLRPQIEIGFLHPDGHDQITSRASRKRRLGYFSLTMFR